MRQVIRKGLKEIIVDEVPDPVLRRDHVIVQPAYSLISSGTESASIHRGSIAKQVAQKPKHLEMVWRAAKEIGPLRTLSEVRAKFQEYAVLGYSGAGFVLAKHESVLDLEVGDRVAYGGEGTGHSERVLVGRNLVARVPDNVPLNQACFTTLGSIALNAVRIAQIELGDVVAVVGSGLVGQLVGQLVRCHGGRVVALDLLPDRTGLAEKLGAEESAVGGDAARAAVGKLTAGRGADCVIVAAAAKSDGPCRQALEIVRDRGRMVVVGAVELSFPWLEMYLKEVKLFMARAYGPGSYDPLYEVEGQDYPLPYVRWTENRNMEEFLRLTGEGKVLLEDLVTHEYALDDAAEAYDTILDPAAGSLAVVLRYPEDEAPTHAYEPRTRIDIAQGATARSSGAELGIALLGAGNLARWDHLPNLKKLPGVALRAICSSSGVRGKSYARRFGAEYCCSDFNDVLTDPDVDAVLIASRNQYHADQTVAALKAGKHVFVEKPMALTEDECREIHAVARDADLQLTVGFNRRFADLYVAQKDAISRRSGPAVVDCRVNSPGISGAYWMADPRIGGAILGEACHFVDLMYWLLDSEIVSVSAYSLPVGDGEPVGQNNIVASFSFEDGSVGNLTYCTVGTAEGGGERVEAFSPGIVARSEDFKKLEIHGAVSKQRSKHYPDKGYRAQLENFVDSIRTGKPTEVTLADGVRSTIACLRILESAASGSPCAIDWESTLKAK